jgi:hypothetical protein
VMVEFHLGRQLWVHLAGFEPISFYHRSHGFRC